MNTNKRDLTSEVQSCIKQLEQFMEASMHKNYEQEMPAMPTLTTQMPVTAQLHQLNVPVKTAALQEKFTERRMSGTYEQEMLAMPASTTRSAATTPHDYLSESDKADLMKENLKAAYLKEIYEQETLAMPTSTTRSSTTSALHYLNQPVKPSALQDAIFKSVNCSIIATDVNGVIQIYNAGAERMLGYASADVINKKTTADLCQSDELKNRAKALSVEFGTSIKTGIETLTLKASQGVEDIYELSYIRNDGSTIPVVMTVTALRQDDEDIIGYLFIGTDNINREKERNQLLLSDAALKAIAEGVVITDSEGLTIYANNAYLAMTGYSLDELMGNNLSMLQGRLTDTNDISAVRKSIDSGSIYSGEILNYKKDGSIFWNHMTISPIENNITTKKNYIGITKDITARKKNDEQNRSFAYLDPLTNLPNRRLLHDRMQQAIAGNSRSGNHSALIVLDFDNFKILNDSYGHEAGDLFLIETAKRLKNCTRENDTVARLGGDEFIILLNNLNTTKEIANIEAVKVSEKIKDLLSKTFLIENDLKNNKNIEYNCNVSLGLVLFTSPEISLNNIINCADSAMYSAKKTGKNSISLMEFEELNTKQRNYG